MQDFRISVGLPTHPKTKKLIRRLGTNGAWHFVCLLAWVTQNKPDGDLSSMNNEDVELAADWQGEPNAFIVALKDVGFIDGEELCYRIHDWHVHNPFVASHEKRSLIARNNIEKRWSKRLQDSNLNTNSIEKDTNGIKNDTGRIADSKNANTESCFLDTPIPNPIPNPIPIPIPNPIPNPIKRQSKKNINGEKEFVIPTLEEIETHCKLKNKNVDAYKFFNFYQSKGWLVGKTKMKDWKAAINTWDRGNAGKDKDNDFAGVL